MTWWHWSRICTHTIICFYMFGWYLLKCLYSIIPSCNFYTIGQIQCKQDCNTVQAKQCRLLCICITRVGLALLCLHLIVLRFHQYHQYINGNSIRGRSNWRSSFGEVPLSWLCILHSDSGALACTVSAPYQQPLSKFVGNLFSFPWAFL